MASRLDLIIRIAAQTAGAVNNVGQATTAFERMETRVRGLAAPATAAIGAVVALGKSAADSASRQEQAMGSLDSVFGANADQVKAWSDQAALSVGLSKAEYAELASVMGAQMKNMGMDLDTAAASTNSLVSLGADLSAAFGGSSKEAVEALGSALRGEADPAERYGLSLKQSTINAHLAAKGQDTLTGAALEAAKAQAIVELATSQAGGVVGQFSREADTAAGAQQRAAAQWEDASATLGTALLPYLQQAASWVAQLSTWLKDNEATVRTVGAVLLGMAGSVLAVNAALKVYRAGQVAWTVVTRIASLAQLAFNAAMRANPMMKVVALVTLVVGAIVALWNNCEGFRTAVLAVWAAVQAAFQVAVDFIVGLVTGLGDILAGVWEAIVTGVTAAWEWVGSIITGVWTTITDTTTAVWDGITGFLGGIWDGITSAASAAWLLVESYIVDPLQSAWDWITGTFGAVGGWFSSLWTGITTTASTVWGTIYSWIVDPLQNAWNWITGVFSTISTTFSDLWQGIIDTMSSIFGGAADIVSDAFSGVADLIKGVINGIISFINETVIWGINKLIDGANLVPFVDIPHVSQIPLISSAGGVPGWHGGMPMHSGGDRMVFNITGALDPDRTARQIEQLLGDRARRTGPLRITR